MINVFGIELTQQDPPLAPGWRKSSAPAPVREQTCVQIVFAVSKSEEVLINCSLHISPMMIG